LRVLDEINILKSRPFKNMSSFLRLEQLWKVWKTQVMERHSTLCSINLARPFKYYPKLVLVLAELSISWTFCNPHSAKPKYTNKASELVRMSKKAYGIFPSRRISFSVFSWMLVEINASEPSECISIRQTRTVGVSIKRVRMESEPSRQRFTPSRSIYIVGSYGSSGAWRKIS